MILNRRKFCIIFIVLALLTFSSRLLKTRRHTSFLYCDKLVVSLSTKPARFNEILPTIFSLLNQTVSPDKIFLSVEAEFTIPEKQFPEKVKILRPPESFGAATKLLPTLFEETVCPSTTILVVDDDFFYPHRHIETLIKGFRKKTLAAVGCSGGILQSNFTTLSVGSDRSGPNELWFPWPSKNEKVDLLQGFCGIMVKASWLDKEKIANFIRKESRLRRADDVIWAAFLEHQGIDRYTIEIDELPILRGVSKIDSMSGGGRMTKIYRYVLPYIQKNLDVWQNFDFEETQMEM